MLLAQLSPLPKTRMHEAVHESQRSTADVSAVLNQVEAELVELDSGPSSFATREEEVVNWLNQVDKPDEIVERAERDPLSWLSNSPPIDERVASLILSARERVPGGRLRALTDIPGLRTGMVADLLYTGRSLGRSTPAGQTIPILLPLRLETRFKRSGSDWTMKLLIVPDEAWIDNHDARPSKEELDALEDWYTAVQRARESTGNEVQAAWTRIADVVGGARAAWLVRTFPPASVEETNRVKVNRPEELQDNKFFSRISSFPSELHIYLARAGEAPRFVATSPIKRDRLLLTPAGWESANAEPDRDWGSYEEVIEEDRKGQRWWDSYDEAKDVGLGVEIDLGPDADNIDALYVVGVSDESPAELFASHRDAGRLGILKTGTPTNTVSGAPAAVAARPSDWLETLRTPMNATEQEISLLITGERHGMGSLPGVPETHSARASALVKALWPVLWGHPLKDLWGASEAVHDLGALSAHALHPEGPFPPLRIGDQPYGVLPVTSLSSWSRFPNEPVVLDRLVPFLHLLIRGWAATAEAAGTADGADTKHLLDLLGRVPVSSKVNTRWYVPLELSAMFLLVDQVEQLFDDWDRATGALRDMIGRSLGVPQPARHFSALDAPKRLRIPLIGDEEADMRTLFAGLATLAGRPGSFVTLEAIAQGLGLSELPDDLLFRLLVRSLQYALADLGRTFLQRAQPAQDPEPTIEDVAFGIINPGAETRMQRWIAAVADYQYDDDSPAAATLDRVLEGLAELSDLPKNGLERAFMATLDCASHRMDAWATALATYRLMYLLHTSQPTAPRIGAYGWVDHPAPGDSGPDEAGLLLAPSDPHVMTSAVILDRYRNTTDGRWEMNITSTGVRDARRLADAVRQGVHPAEHLGSEVERIIDNDAVIELLRQRFPLRQDDGARRVCDGRAVLATDLADVALTTEARRKLDQLRRSIDVYGDLLLAEAAYRVVEGRGDQAGTALDAAAGLAPPPDLELLRTARASRSVGTTCLAVLPAGPPVLLPDPPGAHIRPVTLAEPALADFVDRNFPSAASWTWSFTLTDGSEQAITLQDMELTPSDTLTFSPDELETCARRHAERRSSGEIVLEDATGTNLRRMLSRFVQAFGGRPASPSDFLSLKGASKEPLASEVDETDMRTRLGAIRSVLQSLVGEADRLTTGSIVDLVEANQLLTSARRWGIPTGATDTIEDAKQEIISGRVILQSRLERLLPEREPSLEVDPASPQRDRLDELVGIDLLDLAADTVAPNGDIRIFARLPRVALEAFVPSQPDQITGSSKLHLDWLSVVAAVRPGMAKLESVYLESQTTGSLLPSLVGWTNRPDDLWQKSVANGDNPPAQEGRLIVAFAPQEVDVAASSVDQLAIATIDRWVEAIPSANHDLAAAFGFRAPMARAPQSILVAVPSHPTDPLGPNELVSVLATARELARARMALPGSGQLADLAAALPLSTVPIAGPTGVELSRKKI